MRRSVVLAACILLFSASHVRAEFYRWVDKEGNEFFTNELEKIPQEYRGSASQVQPDESRVNVGSKPAAGGKSAVTARDHRDRYGRGEEYWSRRAASLRRELKDLEAKYALLLKYEREQARKQEEKREQSAGKGKKSATISDRKKMQLENMITIARRRLEVDLPEEARKADAYPGWIRE